MTLIVAIVVSYCVGFAVGFVLAGLLRMKGIDDNDYRLRTGDVVRHVPSGEDWEVLYADYESGYMSWIGWPPGRARIADCELVRKCTDEQHARDVDLVLDGGHDPAVKARVARLAGRAT